MHAFFVNVDMALLLEIDRSVVEAIALRKLEVLIK